MSRLEEHIRNNREDLNRLDPPAGAWDNISKELKRRKTLRTKWISIAASVVVLLGSAVLLNRQGVIFQSSGRGIRSVSAFENANPELREAEIYYTNLIKSLYVVATPLLNANPEAEKELNIDISQLDSICIDIKKDLKDNVDNQEVVEALIQNYRTRIRILEEMLTVLKDSETDNEKNKDNEL
jgi:hypothetical protein